MTPTSPSQRIVGSYTFFSEMENCPLKAYENRVARSIQRLENDAARWGNYVHDAMEKRIGAGVVLPEDLPDLEQYAVVFDIHRGQKREVHTEAKLCIDAQGRPTRWWGPDAYVAGKVDVTLHLSETHIDITDWKTGKDKYETPFELELHALLIAATIAPQQAYYTARYAYVGREDDAGNPIPDKIGQTYDVSNVGATWAKVNSLMYRANDYQRKGHWPAQKNPLCGWCPVMTCAHNKTNERLAKEGLKK